MTAQHLENIVSPDLLTGPAYEPAWQTLSTSDTSPPQFSKEQPVSFGASQDAQQFARQIIQFQADALSSASYELTPLLTETFVLIEPRNWPRLERKSAAGSDQFNLFKQRLIAILETEPVADGYDHIGEVMLAELIDEHGFEVGEWLASSMFEEGEEPYHASILQLLGRIRPFGHVWRVIIVKRALQSKNLLMRDAAIQAAELWEDPEVLSILRQHHEEYQWLRDYLNKVIQYLEAE